ncbi:MAG: hypothetical protein A2W93_14125 [Bacteroidetes bacterium GWF2_43_63]|nr:MAG: hypothetical protein A2W94_00695 [Bacteroidetes bacterium GWE2_42_42]OFY52479.1 MAG: hypothetical protein A2W93_14125 [Bacteroidetes bacterium GWF2_43_63]HBG71385.1 hypothetical protein [Bacteroidales bacterium]HCB60864.1 hypothetical protein [Bacteroidales bacterium]HCY23411.1 hypothetical protein [Bacteroidales bacterium]
MENFFDEAAISAMNAIISNKQLYADLQSIAISDKVAMNTVIAERAFDIAKAMLDEHNKRCTKEIKVY